MPSGRIAGKKRPEFEPITAWMPLPRKAQTCMRRVFTLRIGSRSASASPYWRLLSFGDCGVVAPSGPRHPINKLFRGVLEGQTFLDSLRLTWEEATAAIERELDYPVKNGVRPLASRYQLGGIPTQGVD